MQITRKILRLAKITFVLYMLLLFWVIALKCNMPVSISDTKAMNAGTTLLERFQRYLSYRSFKSSWEDSVVNVLLFVPGGMLLPFLFQKSPYSKSILTTFLLAVGFEVLQIVSCIGMFTYVDIINNSLGGIIGTVIHFFLRKIAKEKPLSITFYVLCFTMLVVLAYATYNTIIHIEMYF